MALTRKYLLDKKKHQNQLLVDTRDDGRLENHQCLGICEGPHGIVTEKISLEWLGSTLSHLQGDMGKRESNLLDMPSANSLTL